MPGSSVVQYLYLVLGVAFLIILQRGVFEFLLHQLMSQSLLWGVEQIVCASLPGSGHFRYYSSMASLMHVWRDNAASMFDCWVNVLRFDATLAVRCGMHLVPPRPISGRWAQKTHCERHILGKPRHELTAVFEYVVGKRSYFIEARDQPAAKARPKKKTLDDTAVDQTSAYSDVLGKWAHRALRVLGDVRFWVGLNVSATISEKLDTLLWTLEKGSAHILDKEFSNLAPIVFGKGLEVYNGLLSLLDARSWGATMDVASSMLPADGKEEALG